GAPPRLIEVAGGSHATKGGTHAIAIFAHASNPISRLTLDQLKEILTQDGRVRTWGDLGLGGEWAERPIRAYGMLRRRATGNPPGIVNYFEQRVLVGAAWRDDLREQVDTAEAQALQHIVRRVTEEPGAIGFSGFGYGQPGAKTLALADTSAGPFFAGTA